MNSINERISKIIKELGVTPYEFSKKMGNKRPDGLYKILNNKEINPTPKTLNKIKEAYPEINYSWLLTGQGSMLNSGKKKTTGEGSDINFEDVMRYLHENNKILLKNSIFRAFIESNMYILEMEKDKKELEARAAELEELVKKTIKENKSTKS